MQNFAAPFEPESLPGVAVQDWQGLLAAPLLQQLGSCEALLLTVTEESVAGAASVMCWCLQCASCHQQY
jgi:hypothetical protein